jgi:hypothetical protein
MDAIDFAVDDLAVGGPAVDGLAVGDLAVEGLAVEGLSVDEWCAIGPPTSRRFYVHAGSFQGLMLAQSSFAEELGTALALSAASRAAEQVLEDRSMFGLDGVGLVTEPLSAAVQDLRQMAADALQEAFQCLIHLVPPRFGATEFLLGAHEEVNAWCYEDGYFTYATDENAAQVMYAETGSLRQLRSQVRRSPESDPSLRMISGPSLFLFDQKVGVGPGTAKFYKGQHSRLIRQSTAASTARQTAQPTAGQTAQSTAASTAGQTAQPTAGQIDFRLDSVADTLKRVLGDVDDPVAGLDLLGTCLRRAGLTMNAILQSA